MTSEPGKLPEDEDLGGFEVFAYVGQDEFGSGTIGLKQGLAPSGFTALVAVSRSKLDRPDFRSALQLQADRSGLPIRLVRLIYVETVVTLTPRSN